MGSELVKPPRLIDRFNEAFPIYLAYGMTEEQFWDRDSTLVIAYRKKHDIEREEANQMLWLQGLYFYDALVSVAPVMRAFSGAKRPNPYIENPLPLTVKDLRKEEEAKETKKKDETKAKLLAWQERVNKKMREKDGRQHD